jgi:hypothetical protein
MVSWASWWFTPTTFGTTPAWTGGAWVVGCGGAGLDGVLVGDALTDGASGDGVTETDAEVVTVTVAWEAGPPLPPQALTSATIASAPTPTFSPTRHNLKLLMVLPLHPRPRPPEAG